MVLLPLICFFDIPCSSLSLISIRAPLAYDGVFPVILDQTEYTIKELSMAGL